MATWQSRGLRGDTFEEMINVTLDYYRSQNLALIQKIPTPIKPIDIDKETRHITLAYFDQKSTVDYIGAVQGVPVCFDAKECQETSFPLKNIHEHQMEFMKDFEAQGGISFFLIHFTSTDHIYYVPYTTIVPFWERAARKERMSFTIDELLHEVYYEVPLKKAVYVHFLEALADDLDRRDALEEHAEKNNNMG